MLKRRTARDMDNAVHKVWVMSRRVLALASALLLAACSGPSPDTTSERKSATLTPNNPSGCEARVTSSWTVGAGTTLSVEARSLGDSCREALATLIIRSPDGTLLWARAYPASDTMVLREVGDVDGMTAALTEWIEVGDKTTRDLPEWPDEASAPNAGEFPFYPDEGWDAASFSALREQGAPMFCHVQGRESLRCLTSKDGAVSTIGVQTFPG